MPTRPGDDQIGADTIGDLANRRAGTAEDDRAHFDAGLDAVGRECLGLGLDLALNLVLVGTTGGMSPLATIRSSMWASTSLAPF